MKKNEKQSPLRIFFVGPHARTTHKMVVSQREKFGENVTFLDCNEPSGILVTDAFIVTDGKEPPSMSDIAILVRELAKLPPGSSVRQGAAMGVRVCRFADSVESPVPNVSLRDFVRLAGRNVWRTASSWGEHVLLRLENQVRRGETVLIVGETGTGKSLLARTLHQWLYPGEARPVIVSPDITDLDTAPSELFGHCAGAYTGAVQRRVGRVELADARTVIFESIHAVPPTLQAGLLRFFDERRFQRVGEQKERRVDCTVLATATPALDHLLEKGTFRKDLYYRLSRVRVVIPPLRVRKDDIAFYAAVRLRERWGITESDARAILNKEVLGALQQYEWPGNVRQLYRVMDRIAVAVSNGVRPTAILTNTTIARYHRPYAPPASVHRLARLDDGTITFKEATDSTVEEVLVHSLAAKHGNVAKAALMMGISRQTVYRYLDEFGLGPDDFRF